MVVHHIGYAVKDLEAGIAAFEQLGYTAGGITQDEARRVRICFLKSQVPPPRETLQSVTVELIAPDGTSSPVDGVLKKMGATPYHICYSTPNLEEAISALTEDGSYMLVSPPAPAPAIGGCCVAFLWSRAAGLIELVEL